MEHRSITETWKPWATTELGTNKTYITGGNRILIHGNQLKVETALKVKTRTNNSGLPL